MFFFFSFLIVFFKFIIFVIFIYLIVFVEVFLIVGVIGYEFFVLIIILCVLYKCVDFMIDLKFCGLVMLLSKIKKGVFFFCFVLVKMLFIL